LNAKTGVSDWAYGCFYEKPDGGMHKNNTVQEYENWLAK
jgi:hypothetical protein